MRFCTLLLLTVASTAFANAGGITGRSGKQTVTCSSCHAQSGQAPTVTVTGPTSLTAGVRAKYTVTLTGGPGAWGGVDIGTDSGLLSIANSTLRYYTTANELAHSDKKAFAAGSVSWDFYWLAPSTPGSNKLYVAAQSVNGDGNTSADREAITTYTVAITAANQPPTVMTAPAASPAPVVSNTTALSVRGSDDQAETGLVYTWTSMGPAAVVFSANASNAAKNTTATFTRAGAYVFTVKIADAANLFVNATLAVTVNATYTTLKVTPPSRTLALGSTQGLSAAAFDQFGQAMTNPGTVSWAATAGTITAAGLYTTPATAGGPHTITATCAGKTGTSAITVVAGTPPTVASAASATVVTNKTFTLRALGADDGGEGLLKYTWSATGPAAVTFSPNGTNAAKQATATLARSGEYVFTVTIEDRAGLNITSTVTKTIDADLTSVRVTPAAATVKPSASVQLTASPLDQFGRAMTSAQPIAWVSFGGGTVSSTGMYRAGTTLGGPFQVRATLLGKTSVSDVTIANDGVPVLIADPTATPAVVAGRTTRLRLTADDEAGEAGLTYQWESVGPAPVTFSPNGTNAAKQATAAFEQAGAYTLMATITNAAGKSTAAEVMVEVQANAERLVITPDSVVLRANGMQPFTASLADQFGDDLTWSGDVTWSTPNAGSISDTGMLRALGTPGRYVVNATAMGLRGTAQVLVDSAAPSVELESPLALAQLEGTVKLVAHVTDDGVLAAVRFYADGALLGTATAQPYELEWSTMTVADGSHELELQAEDAAGNVSKSMHVQVQVWNDKTRPAPGPAPGEGMGCSASGVSLLPLLGLVVVLAALRRRATVSRAGQSAGVHKGDTFSNLAASLGLRGGTGGAQGKPMFRLLFASTLLTAFTASAQLTAEQRERCATRLSVNVLGTAPTAALLSATDPRGEVPNLLASPLFVERFASFINSRFAPEPSRYATQDTPYYLAKKILTEVKPWKDLFIGPYSWERQVGDANGSQAPVIVDDPNGLGYTSSNDWRNRYKGNELEGYRLVHAYRLINNVLGMELKAALNTDGVSAEGRKASTCSGCHYHPVFGLDLIARVLPLRNRTAPADVPQVMLGGKTITTERELLTAMVESNDFRFNVCRTAMRYAYGRPEYKCEGPVFDACMNAFTATPTMQAALSAVLRHQTYCQ